MRNIKFRGLDVTEPRGFLLNGGGIDALLDPDPTILTGGRGENFGAAKANYPGRVDIYRSLEISIQGGIDSRAVSAGRRPRTF